MIIVPAFVLNTLRRRRWLVIPVSLFTLHINAQDSVSTTGAKAVPAASPVLPSARSANRQWLVGGINVVGYGGTLAILSSTWYSKETRSGFHTFNDSREWLQVDKTGHGWTAYNAARANTAMWDWAGLDHRRSVLIGSITSAAFITGIEVLDAYSSKWGWSWSDIGANVTGSGLFVGQELLWKEQRIQFKFSFHSKDYHEPQLEERADDLFGRSWPERMLKDYNAQTYWFSVNPRSFAKDSRFPAWLNIAVGYGADGMLGGFENRWAMDGQSQLTDRTDIRRKRQFFLSPDIDFTKIPTKSRFMRSAFFVLNAFKFPAPALMLDNRGRFRAYAIYF